MFEAFSGKIIRFIPPWSELSVSSKKNASNTRSCIFIYVYSYYRAPTNTTGSMDGSQFGRDSDAGQSEGRLRTGRVWGAHKLSRLRWKKCYGIAAALDYDRTGPPRLGAKTLPPLRQVVLSPLPEGAPLGGISPTLLKARELQLGPKLRTALGRKA